MHKSVQESLNMFSEIVQPEKFSILLNTCFNTVSHHPDHFPQLIYGRGEREWASYIHTDRQTKKKKQKHSRGGMSNGGT